MPYSKDNEKTNTYIFVASARDTFVLFEHSSASNNDLLLAKTKHVHRASELHQSKMTDVAPHVCMKLYECAHHQLRLESSHLNSRKNIFLRFSSLFRNPPALHKTPTRHHLPPWTPPLCSLKNQSISKYNVHRVHAARASHCASRHPPRPLGPSV